MPELTGQPVTGTTVCIAYREDGLLCRAPATILDPQRGGLVCVQHVPAAVAEARPRDRKDRVDGEATP
jgi:hypothetical protein